MELKAAHQITAFENNPNEWTVGKLGDLLSICHGKSQKEVEVADGPYPILATGGQIGTASRPLFSKPSVLIGRKGTINQPQYMDTPFWSVDTLFYSLILGQNSAKFLYYKFLNINWLQFNEASGVPSLNARTIENIPVSYPSPAEQLVIADVLSDIDALIAGLEKLIAKKRDLKQAAMQQLLTGQTRLPGFSGVWAKNDLKNLVSTPITDGPHLTPTFYETGVPFLSVNNLANNRIDWSDLRFISKADDEIFSRKCKPRKGDVLLGKAASVGKVAIVEDDIDFNIWSPIALIRAGAKVNAKFLYYQLLSADCISQVMLLTNASSQGNIGMGDIEKLQISYPCYGEQAAIAEVLADMDAELGSLETRLAKTRELKQGMMQELLTGKTRLLEQSEAQQ